MTCALSAVAPTSAARPAASVRGCVVALIPALDEAPTIAAVVRAVPPEIAGVPTVVLVVDDGSTDGTGDAARAAGAVVVRHETPQGGGAALRAGYRVAVDGGARVVVTLDADGQHVPAEMPALVEPVLAGRAQLAAGSRVLGSAEPNRASRELGIRVFNRIVSRLTGHTVTDCSNSYRAIDVGLLGSLDLRENQFHASELLIEALSRGASMIEVPITVRARQAGETKKPATLGYGYGFARAIARSSTRALRRSLVKKPTA